MNFHALVILILLISSNTAIAGKLSDFEKEMGYEDDDNNYPVKPQKIEGSYNNKDDDSQNDFFADLLFEIIGGALSHNSAQPTQNNATVMSFFQEGHFNVRYQDSESDISSYGASVITGGNFLYVHGEIDRFRDKASYLNFTRVGAGIWTGFLDNLHFGIGVGQYTVRGTGSRTEPFIEIPISYQFNSALKIAFNYTDVNKTGANILDSNIDLHYSLNKAFAINFGYRSINLSDESIRGGRMGLNYKW